MSDWYIAQLARQDGYGDEPRLAGPPGALAAQSSYDPFERAAARTRFGAKPLGGRQEGVATTLPQEILAAPVRAAAGFTKAAFDRAAEQTGDVSQISTDYDPRRMGAFLGAETALNTTGFGTPFAQAGALGSAGGKAVMGELASQAPPFYSAVERAVQGAKQNVAPGQQWAGYLRNQPGVKPEEIEALKLGQLFEQPGAVPKQAVLDQIAANRVNVGETTLGREVSPETIEAAKRAYKEFDDYNEVLAAKYNINPYHSIGMYRRIKNIDPAEVAKYDELQRIKTETQKASESGSTKFQQYTLPGGENYREMLLTLPKKVGPKEAEAADLTRRMHAGEFNNLNEAEREAFFKRLHALNTEKNAEVAANAPFTSGHYDEPNILAHVRTNDRVIDGKKTLFVEEVQSDWHQKGRTKGYQADKTTLQREYEDALKAANEHAPGSPEYQAGYQRASQLAARLTDASAVPDAPFKTTWPELAMKRIIREAAEKGYDKVAWTPGSVQAARYDLSKQVDRVTYSPETKHLRAYKDGEVVIRKEAMPDELADYVGKEAAAKLLQTEIKPDAAFKGASSENVHSLSGLDLQVGGEGMKGFYDEILPSTVNKLVKKHGGRVQQGGFATNAEGWHITPPDQTTHGKWMVKSSDYNSKGLRFDTEAEAQAALAEKMKQNQVHTIDITPSLREQALKKGFPLFTAGGVAATGVMGELARQNEYRRQ